MPFKVDHFAFQVSDMDAAIEFYQNKLGFPFLSRQIDEEHGEEFSYFELDGGNLELLRKFPSTIVPNIRDPKKRINCPHLALATENIDDIVLMCKKHNIPILEGPFTISGQVSWIYIADPDENILEFVHWIKK